MVLEKCPCVTAKDIKEIGPNDELELINEQLPPHLLRTFSHLS